MAMVLVLLPAADAETALRPSAMSALSRLGITNVALLRDSRTLGLVLEGWAFDPERSAQAVVDAVADATSAPRILRTVAELAVPPARDTRRNARDTVAGASSEQEHAI